MIIEQEAQLLLTKPIVLRCLKQPWSAC